MAPATMTPTEFAHLVGDPRRVEEHAADSPIVWVDLDDPTTVTAAPDWATTPLVVAGLLPDATETEAPGWLDVIVDAADADALASTVDRCPLAAAAFVLLLRGAEHRSVEHGLIAESTTYSMLQAGPEFASWRASTPARPAGDDGDPRVAVTRSDERLDIVMTRPARHNAIDTAMRDALAEALELAVLDDSITDVHLRGDGPSFCSGGDLDAFGEFVDVADAHRVRLLRSPARLAALVGPWSTAHLHGAAVGGGIEIAAFAGHVVAAEDTTIRLPEVGLGLVPGAGGTVSLPRRIGRHRTALLGLTGRTLDAPTALAWGLVDEVSP